LQSNPLYSKRINVSLRHSVFYELDTYTPLRSVQGMNPLAKSALLLEWNGKIIFKKLNPLFRGRFNLFLQRCLFQKAKLYSLSEGEIGGGFS